LDVWVLDPAGRYDSHATSPPLVLGVPDTPFPLLRRALSVKVAATTSTRKESAIELCLMPYGTDVTNVGAPVKTSTNGCESWVVRNDYDTWRTFSADPGRGEGHRVFRRNLYVSAALKVALRRVASQEDTMSSKFHGSYQSSELEERCSVLP